MFFNLLKRRCDFQNFLLLAEKDHTTRRSSPLVLQRDVSTNNGAQNSNGYLEKVGVDILNASATWDESQNSNTLNGVSLKIRPGQSIAIVGPVGAGKVMKLFSTFKIIHGQVTKRSCILSQSSVIQLILRELPLSEGKVSVRGEVSYASQEPWLFTGSVQQNILFDSPMNDERYKQVNLFKIIFPQSFEINNRF